MPRFPHSPPTAAISSRNSLSRRQIFIGVAATAISPHDLKLPDPAIPACSNWCALQAHHEALTKRWQEIERYLIRHHNWFDISRRARAAIPEAQELVEIDGRLEAIHDAKQQLLAALPDMVATSARGLASKLAVAAACVRPEADREAHDLIKSILRDLQTMMRR